MEIVHLIIFHFQTNFNGKTLRVSNLFFLMEFNYKTHNKLIIKMLIVITSSLIDFINNFSIF